MVLKNITIGTDPELFLISNKTNKLVPSVGLIGGTKYEPKKIKKGGFAIQEDNVMVEFNVPYTTLDNPSKLWKDITFVFNYLKKLVSKFDCDLLISPAGYFDWKDLDTEQARVFGCDPDFNAWTESINCFDKVETNLRSCGGHVHIGYELPNVQDSTDLIRILDLYLGVPSIIKDTDTERRKLYGKAGCFRFTDFGCEYRVLSNFWVASEENVNWLFSQITKAINAFNTGFRIDKDSELAKNIQKCINTSNIELAKQLINSKEIALELV